MAETMGKTALLVIDAQIAMFDPEMPPHDGERVLANIRTLIDGARTAGTPVIYVRHEDAHYEPMQPGGAGFDVHPAIAPVPGEAIVDKRACDAFYETPLEQTLRQIGTEHVVVTGLQTEFCIDTACRSALHRDFGVTLAADAHTTYPRDDASAEQIIAHHNHTLAGIPHPTREIAVRLTAEIRF